MMGESATKGLVTFDESHVNIKLPNRCRRCHFFNEDPSAPSLRESYVILLQLMMTKSIGDVCFLLCLALPCLALTVVSLTMLMLAGYGTLAGALFHSGVFLFMTWVCVVRYFGRRYSTVYSTEKDLLHLNAPIVM
ncbi:hypothetical protein OTU49_017266 [Cherax quadricarinatus]|uniref:Uncharacterized protein n=1 Tax=Cherax quadricarinatus TaxID=27406 RepID=A0AAW0XQU5_CHEQU|nr:uncharacterized protein LOC128689255 [Cherax quadricarinatus]